MLEDSTGCIYVTGEVPAGLSFASPRGEALRVEGVLEIAEGGTPYLSARSVVLMPPSP
jgi:hypothetical protein